MTYTDICMHALTLMDLKVNLIIDIAVVIVVGVTTPIFTLEQPRDSRPQGRQPRLFSPPRPLFIGLGSANRRRQYRHRQHPC